MQDYHSDCYTSLAFMPPYFKSVLAKHIKLLFFNYFRYAVFNRVGIMLIKLHSKSSILLSEVLKVHTFSSQQTIMFVISCKNRQSKVSFATPKYAIENVCVRVHVDFAASPIHLQENGTLLLWSRELKVCL